MAHVEFPNSGNKYSWRKVTTTVHNIIVGKLWVDQHGKLFAVTVELAYVIEGTENFCHYKSLFILNMHILL